MRDQAVAQLDLGEVRRRALLVGDAGQADARRASARTRSPPERLGQPTRPRRQRAEIERLLERIAAQPSVRRLEPGRALDGQPELCPHGVGAGLGHDRDLARGTVLDRGGLRALLGAGLERDQLERRGPGAWRAPGVCADLQPLASASGVEGDRERLVGGQPFAVARLADALTDSLVVPGVTAASGSIYSAYAIGGKTGYTNLAKETYVAMAQRGGTRLVAVMMYGSDDLWDQGRALLDWGFSQSGQ